MSDDVIIRVEGLGKKYRLGQKSNERYTALRDVLTERTQSLFRRNRNGKRSKPNNEIWALRDVSFEVKWGEVVGIIGRNGAGKSTLLKILSRITEPTEGRVRLKGRVASLLEVGTGFHPELTGRENIFLNGAILGMARTEIKAKFEEIVAFAEIEKFLDTPVKRYSSGMYVRLAFAVAAHLEPEILIIDEVLAVGDAEFQRKCLNKMEGMSTQGRTVLFVSHQIAAVTRLCQTALRLDLGRIQDIGKSDAICSRYLAHGSSAAASREWSSTAPSSGNKWVRLLSVEATADGMRADNVQISRPVHISVNYKVLEGGKTLIPNIHLYSEDGTLIFISHDWHSGWRSKPKCPGVYRTIFTVPPNFFNEGRVSVKVVISTYQPFEVHLDEPDAIAFTVLETTEDLSARGDYGGHIPGVVRPMLETRTEFVSA